MMHRLSLSAGEVAWLKNEAVRGKPYADRVSMALAFRLLGAPESGLDAWAVLDELDHLEGIKGTSRTKGACPFRRPPLKPLWHKHFSSARHVGRNIGVRWNLGGNGNKDLDAMLHEVARDYGDDPESWPKMLAHRIVEGYSERMRRGLTGDWIIFGVHEGRNYYLDLATHEEGTPENADRLFAKLQQGSAAEFPFLFEILARTSES